MKAKEEKKTTVPPAEDSLPFTATDSLYFSEMSKVPLSAFVLAGKVASFEEASSSTANNWSKIDAL